MYKNSWLYGKDLYKYDGGWRCDMLKDCVSVSYGSFVDVKTHYFNTTRQDGKEPLFVEVPYTLHSDYGGDGTVAEANCEYLAQEYGDLLGVCLWRVWGGYYSTDGFYILASIFEHDFAEDCGELGEHIEELKNDVAGLDDYPLFSDDYLSEVESKIEYEAWDSWLLYDLKRALIQAGVYNDDTMPADQDLPALFAAAAERANEYPIFESHDTVYWDIDKVLECWEEREEVEE